MYSALINLIVVIFVLGVMILVHEFGHFAAAKSLGVRVEVFSIGFGRRLIGFRRGETDYRISILPFLGGYVKMSGENPMDARTGDAREFLSHPRWHRFIIALAGPFMNIVLAVALLTVVYMVHYEHPQYLDEPAKIGYVMQGSPAEKIGIQPGDEIVRLDGLQHPTWEQVGLKVLLSPNQPLEVAVQRGSEIMTKTIVPQAAGRDQVGTTGWLPESPVQVAKVDPGMPAARAGIKSGDVIVALNHEPVRSIEALLAYFERHRDAPVVVTVVRADKQMDVNATPVLSQVEGKPRYRLGFEASQPVHIERLPFTAAFAQSIDTNREYSKLILLLVEKMVQRKVSMRQISGPIGIMQVSGEAAREPGWTPLMQVMAMISLNLGIFNLFPIPIMDGGVILLLAVEGLMRRDISLRIKERIYQAAFVFLILFAAMVIYNDIAKNIPSLGGRLP